MEKSNIAQGQMFIQFPQPIAELQDTPKPRVWVKVSETDDTEPSLFIDNSACARFAIDNTSKPTIAERWLISDRFYGEKVRKGEFVPISDLNEASRICEELGWPSYDINI
jgi:hypothetical protein